MWGGGVKVGTHIPSVSCNLSLTHHSVFCISHAHTIRIPCVTYTHTGGQDGTELDVEVLRVALLLETWEGEGPDGWTNASIFNQQPTQQPLVGKYVLGVGCWV